MTGPMIRILLFCALSLTLPVFGQQKPKTSEELFKNNPEIGEDVRQKVRAMQQVDLVISSLLSAETSVDRKEAAWKVITEIVSEGDPVLATHAITFLSYSPSEKLEPAIRERLKATDDSWAGRHLTISLNHYLALLGDEACFAFLADCVESDDPTCRLRGFRSLRDIHPESVSASEKAQIRKKLRRAYRNESDPAAKSAALAALVCWENPKRAKAYLEKLSDATELTDQREKIRAAIELNQLKLWANDAKIQEKLQKKFEQDEIQNAPRAKRFAKQLRDMARNGEHDERMFALELLAQIDDKPTEKAMERLALSESWKKRLQSAFFISLQGDSEAAFSRLESEEHPFVQLALVCATAN